MNNARQLRVSLLLSIGLVSLAAGVTSTIARAQTSTATTLAVTSACPRSGCVATLTATVTAGTVAVHPGLVVFCDGTALNCGSGAPIGRAQLLANGTASIKLALSPGAHTLRAVFPGTKTYSGSTSSTQNLTVTPSAADQATKTYLVGANPVPGGFTFETEVTTVGPLPATGSVALVDTSNNNAVIDGVGLGTVTSTFAYLPANPLDFSQIPSNLLTGAVFSVAGDFNGDGFQDIAETDANGVLSVFLGNGNGTFTQAPAFNGATGAHGPLLVADFNGDGKLDIAIPDSATKKVYVGLGNGDGTFTSATPTALTYSPQVLYLADFNGDGIPDLVSLSNLPPSGNNTYPAGTAFQVMLGQGNGTFTPQTPISFVGDTVTSLAISDFNLDGIPDIALSYFAAVGESTQGTTILIYEGDGDGSFATTPAASLTGPTGLLAAGDFDGDGIPDLMSGGVSTITLYHGNGNFTFSGKSLGLSDNLLSPLFVGDFTGSGALQVADITYGGIEIIGGSTVNGPISIVTAQGTVGGFGGPGVNPSIADFNGDGLPDFFFVNQFGATMPVGYEPSISSSYLKTSGTVALGEGIHAIVASYSGDSTHNRSVSQTPVEVDSSGIGYTAGFTSTSALTLGGSATVQSNAIQLTDGKPFEAGSFFNSKRIPFGPFQTDFDFQLTNATADGFAFVLQSNGPDAIGSPGGGLGYGNVPGLAGASITNSLAVAFDLHNNLGEGSNSVRLEANGVTSGGGAIDLTPYGLDLHSGDRFHARIIAAGGVNPLYGFNVIITDLQTEKAANIFLQFTTPFSTLNDTGYVGFTGGTGAGTATQTILNWSYELTSSVVNLPYPPPTFPDGFAGTAALTFNGGSTINGTALQLTNGTTFERTSTYFSKKLGPGSGFSTDFDFDLGSGSGDGFTFVIQNGHIGSVGSSGGGLGYGPALPGAAGYSIGDSTAIKFDLHNDNGEGNNSTGIYVNGASPTTPSIDITPSGLNLHSGHTFHAHISYMPAVSGAVTLTITDLTVYKVFETSFAGNSHNLASLPFAFVGFTAGTGATPSSIKVLNWTFTNFDQ